MRWKPKTYFPCFRYGDVAGWLLVVNWNCVISRFVAAADVEWIISRIKIKKFGAAISFFRTIPTQYYLMMTHTDLIAGSSWWASLAIPVLILIIIMNYCKNFNYDRLKAFENSCVYCYATPAYKRCNKCQVVHYCRRDCQLLDFKRHRTACNWIVQNEGIKVTTDYNIQLFQGLGNIDSRLLKAASLGVLKEVQNLLAEDADINFIYRGGTALSLAEQFGQRHVVRFLIRAGANVNIADPSGLTPLQLACYDGDEEIVRELIVARAEINTSALASASQEGHVGVIRLLIAAGADINNSDSNGFSPLMIASHCNQVELARMLIDEGANLHDTNNKGHSPIMLASQQGMAEVAEVLVSAGASVDRADVIGFTPLMYASQQGHANVAHVLITAGASVNYAASNGCSALIRASQGGHARVAEVLITAGANVDQSDINGCTPFMWAGHEGHVEVGRVLIDADADTGRVNLDGQNAYNIAMEHGRLDFLALLINPSASA